LRRGEVNPRTAGPVVFRAVMEGVKFARKSRPGHQLAAVCVPNVTFSSGPTTCHLYSLSREAFIESFVLKRLKENS